jgi:hypothetical protein
MLFLQSNDRPRSISLIIISGLNWLYNEEGPTLSWYVELQSW